MQPGMREMNLLPVLVGYATGYGSTHEVAENVAATLRERGFAVDVRPLRDVTGLDPYRAVVIGAPFYLGSWHADAQRFLARHRGALEHLPVAIFALGPINPDDDMDEAHAQLEQEIEKHAWLTPVTAEMFGGKFDPSRLRLVHKLLTALPASPLHGLPATDLRDWDTILAWATGLAEDLQQRAVNEGA